MWRVLKIWFLAWLAATGAQTVISASAVLAFGPYSDVATFVSMIAGFLLVIATFVWLFRRYRAMWRARYA